MGDRDAFLQVLALEIMPGLGEADALGLQDREPLLGFGAIVVCLLHRCIQYPPLFKAPPVGLDQVGSALFFELLPVQFFGEPG